MPLLPLRVWRAWTRANRCCHRQRDDNWMPPSISLLASSLSFTSRLPIHSLRFFRRSSHPFPSLLFTVPSISPFHPFRQDLRGAKELTAPSHPHLLSLVHCVMLVHVPLLSRFALSLSILALHPHFRSRLLHFRFSSRHVGYTCCQSSRSVWRLS